MHGYNVTLVLRQYGMSLSRIVINPKNLLMAFKVLIIFHGSLHPTYVGYKRKDFP